MKKFKTEPKIINIEDTNTTIIKIMFFNKHTKEDTIKNRIMNRILRTCNNLYRTPKEFETKREDLLIMNLSIDTNAYIENKVIYIGDALFSEKELKGIPYIYDIEKHLNTIEQLKKYKDLIIISPHCGIINNLEETINQNKEEINKTKQMIINMCKKEKTINDILEHIIKEKQIELNKINYYPITATIRSFISYLLDKDIIEMDFKKKNLYYKTKNDIIK